MNWVSEIICWICGVGFPCLTLVITACKYLDIINILCKLSFPNKNIPEGYNSAEIVRIYKGKISHEDVNSLLIRLAINGYIKICDVDGKPMIVQLKDYAGDDKYEAKLYEELFANATCYEGSDNSIMASKAASYEDLKKFYRSACFDITRDINCDDKKMGLTKKSSPMNKSSKRDIDSYLPLLSVVPAILMACISKGINSETITLFIIIPFVLIGMATATGVSKGTVLRGRGGNPASLVSVIAGSMLVLQPLSMVYSQMTGVTPILKGLSFVLVISSLAAIGIGRVNENKKTISAEGLNKLGYMLLGKARGLMKYITGIKVKKLEKTLQSNPEHYYEMLPYAIAFGKATEWLEKGKEAKVNAPEWYTKSDEETDEVDFEQFSRGLTEVLSELEKL